MLPVLYTINVILIFYILSLLINQVNYIMMLLLVDVIWIFILVMLSASSIITSSTIFIFLTLTVLCLSTIEFIINLSIVYNSYFKND